MVGAKGIEGLRDGGVATVGPRRGWAADDPRLPWPLPAGLMPLLYAWLGWSWWRETQAQIVAAGEPTLSVGVGTMAAIAVGARALATVAEAGAYTLWWRSRSLRLPSWRFTAWVAALSAADLFGFALRRAAQGSNEPFVILIAVLAGPAALARSPVTDSGWLAAFGSLGVLALVRIGATAWAQARGIGRPVAATLLVTAVAWLMTRLAAWWSFDLVRGMSPVR